MSFIVYFWVDIGILDARPAFLFYYEFLEAIIFKPYWSKINIIFSTYEQTLSTISLWICEGVGGGSSFSRIYASINLGVF